MPCCVRPMSRESFDNWNRQTYRALSTLPVPLVNFPWKSLIEAKGSSDATSSQSPMVWYQLVCFSVDANFLGKQIIETSKLIDVPAVKIKTNITHEYSCRRSLLAEYQWGHCPSVSTCLEKRANMVSPSTRTSQWYSYINSILTKASHRAKTCWQRSSDASPWQIQSTCKLYKNGNLDTTKKRHNQLNSSVLFDPLLSSICTYSMTGYSLKRG
jgi:hypothetical protein